MTAQVKTIFSDVEKKGTKQRERERGGMMLFLLYMCNALRKALTGLLSPIKSYKHLSRDNSEPNRLRVPQHADISSKKKLFFKKKKTAIYFHFVLPRISIYYYVSITIFFPFLSEFPHVGPCNYFSRQKDTIIRSRWRHNRINISDVFGCCIHAFTDPLLEAF